MEKFPQVRHVSPVKGMSVNDLVRQMRLSGVMGGGAIGKAADIMEGMINDRDCTVFFGQAGAMVPGGMKEVLIGMLEDKWIDVFATTGATLTHDLVESLGHSHFQGHGHMDDEKLNRMGYDRMWDSLMPSKVYEDLEDFMELVFKTLPADTVTIKDFLWHIGSRAPKRSILKTCFEKKIPLFCPAISDSGIGLMVWNYIQSKKLNISAFEDLKEIMDIAWTCRKAGVIYVGGGVPKNYIQQAMQLTKLASYGVQISTDMPQYGGSSGAELREGISWGKMQPDAYNVNIYVDATIALPILRAALLDRIHKQ